MGQNPALAKFFGKEIKSVFTHPIDQKQMIKGERNIKSQLLTYKLKYVDKVKEKAAPYII